MPCITASAEETCDHLINKMIAKHGCPMTFQSDNGLAFVGELTKNLAHETLTGGSSSLHGIPSPDEWLSGEAKSDVGVNAEGILFQIHDRLGQIPSTSDGRLQHHSTLHHWS